MQTNFLTITGKFLETVTPFINNITKQINKHSLINILVHLYLKKSNVFETKRSLFETLKPLYKKKEIKFKNIISIKEKNNNF